jgi:hypothetical protein
MAAMHAAPSFYAQYGVMPGDLGKNDKDKSDAASTDT